MPSPIILHGRENQPMPEAPTAMVSKTDIPGLVNVQVTTGEAFYDITLGQLRYLAAKHGWTVVPVEEAPDAA